MDCGCRRWSCEVAAGLMDQSGRMSGSWFVRSIHLYWFVFLYFVLTKELHYEYFRLLNPVNAHNALLAHRDTASIFSTSIAVKQPTNQPDN